MAYTPLRISTVKPHLEISFDLFIHFKGQYLLYASRGATLEEEKYLKLKKQKVAKFFIDEKDELNYQKFLDDLLTNTLNSDKVSVEEKVHLVEGSCNTALERMQKDPGSQSSYNLTQTAAKALLQVIQNDPESLKSIFGKKAGEDDIIIKHSLNVSALSTKMATIFKLKEKEIEDIALAGLIHDIGLTIDSTNSIGLFKKHRKELSAEEKKVYNKHVKDSLTALKEKDYINPEILQLVENHEETLSGDGPNKVKKLSKSEMILSMVNTYDKLIITKEITPKEAIAEMMIEELGNYDLEYLQKFQSVLKKEGLLDL